MKTKQDFITNSSSTSYIFTTGKKLDKVDKTLFYQDLVKSFFNLQVIETLDDMEEIKDIYGWEEDDKEYIKLIDIINKGNSVIYLNIPYGGEVDIDSFFENYKCKILIED